MGGSLTECVEIGNAILYRADCREILPTLPKVDAVVTDPPWGVNFGYESHDDKREGYEDWCAQWFDLCQEKATSILMSPGSTNVTMWARIRPFKWQIAWLKPATMGRSPVGFCNWEPILLWGKGSRNSVDVFTAPIVRSDEVDGHPCPKPIRWARCCLDRVSIAGQTILDPFMGSGTTGVACMNLGRRFIGIEIEKRYFDIACERIDRAQRQGDMFVEAI